MPLTNQKIEQFKRSVQLALNQEWPELARIRRRLASIAPRTIDRDTRHTLPVVGTVATDGGENKIVLDPIRLHVIRVACSTGEIFCEDFVPLSSKPEEILRFFISTSLSLEQLHEKGILFYLPVPHDLERRQLRRLTGGAMSEP